MVLYGDGVDARVTGIQAFSLLHLEEVRIMMVLVRLKLETPSKRTHEIVCSARKEHGDFKIAQLILDRMAADMGLKESDQYKFMVARL